MTSRRIIISSCGDCVHREATGDRHQSEVSMDEARHFVRGKLWDAYDRLILATNPVWIGPDA